MAANAKIAEIIRADAGCCAMIAGKPGVELGFRTNEYTGFVLLRFVHVWTPELGERAGSLLRFYLDGSVEYRNWHHSEGEVPVTGFAEELRYQSTPIQPDEQEEYHGELEEFIKDVEGFARGVLKDIGIEVE